MNIGLYQSAASLTALERWQDTVAQNITSSQVTGFKKRTIEFSSVPMGDIQSAGPRGQQETTGMLPLATVGVSFQAGEITPTKRPLDVAIQGEGFFQAKNAAGDTVYTRAGEIHIRPDHTLTTADGSTLLSDGGAPISLLSEGGEVMIAQDGTITQGGSQIGRIGVVKFPDTAQLTPLGAGFFSAPAKVKPQPADKAQVLQGYLEGSNVTPLREMVSLVQIARAYETNQKLISSRDQTLQRTLETLG